MPTVSLQISRTTMHCNVSWLEKVDKTIYEAAFMRGTMLKTLQNRLDAIWVIAGMRDPSRWCEYLATESTKVRDHTQKTLSVQTVFLSAGYRLISSMIVTACSSGRGTLCTVLLFSWFGHKAQRGGDRRGGLLRIGSWLVDKLANKMLYHLLQCEYTNVQVLSLWIKVRKYENSLVRNSFNLIVYVITIKMRKSVNENNA